MCECVVCFDFGLFLVEEVFVFELFWYVDFSYVVDVFID